MMKEREPAGEGRIQEQAHSALPLASRGHIIYNKIFCIIVILMGSLLKGNLNKTILPVVFHELLGAWRSLGAMVQAVGYKTKVQWHAGELRSTGNTFRGDTHIRQLQVNYFHTLS